MKAVEGESLRGMFFFGSSSTSSMSFASKLEGGAAAITLRVLVKNFCNEGHVI